MTGAQDPTSSVDNPDIETKRPHHKGEATNI